MQYYMYLLEDCDTGGPVMAPPTLRLFKILFPSEEPPELVTVVEVVFGTGLSTLCCCCCCFGCCCGCFTVARPVIAPPLSRL